MVLSISPPGEIVDQIGEVDGIVLRILDQVNLIPKFLHFTLNERLLSAFEGKDKLDIIDFDVKEGLQWLSLFQSLASRPDPRIHLRITGIGNSRQDLQDAGARLKNLAESLHLQFQFHPVAGRLEDVRPWMLHIKEGEFVAFNCVLQLHRVLYDETPTALTHLLGLIQSVKPLILLLGKEEAEHNDPRWEMRFANSLKYYSAVFDSSDSSFVHEDSLLKIKVEEMFARKTRNAICWEGKDRFRGTRSSKTGGGKWRMADSDVWDLEREMVQSRMVLSFYPIGDNFRIKARGDDGEGQTLKWHD